MRYGYLIILSIVAFAAVLCSPSAGFAVSLGSAQDFAVLGASTVTNTGPTTVYGSLGVDPLSAITGFYGTDEDDGPGVVTGGTVHQTDDVAHQAQIDALGAYNTMQDLPSPNDLTDQDLGGMTLSPGVYNFNTTAQLTGTLTLDFRINPNNADFVFQVGTALTTASASRVNVIYGNSLSGVYWIIGSSATLGTDTVFAGNILADQSITLNTRADILCGRVIALNAAVTLDNNRISNNNSAQDFDSDRPDFGSLGFSGGPSPGHSVVPEPSTMLLLGLGGAATAFIRRKRKA